MDSDNHWILKVREQLNAYTADDLGDLAVAMIVFAGWVVVVVLALTGRL